MKSLFTVIIPTFNHVRTLEYSIQSVLNQTIEDFSVIVVGDGAPIETGEILNNIIQKDSRVQYIPNEKGAGHGELYRHEAIVNSRSKYICYLCDDDLWLPEHLEIIEPYLEKHDFINSTFISINPKGDIHFYKGRLQDIATRTKMLNSRWNFFGPTSAAHKRSSYFSLPHGWRPRPDGMWSDLFMWRQWLSQESMSFFTIPIITTLHFPSPQRRDLTLDERFKELEIYWSKINSDFRLERLNELFMEDVISKVIKEEGEITSSKVVKDVSKFIKEHYESLQNNDSMKIKSLEDDLKNVSIELTKLRNAKSTQLGFTLTYPLRKIYDLIYG